jgi:hypothetical protein
MHTDSVVCLTLCFICVQGSLAVQSQKPILASAPAPELDFFGSDTRIQAEASTANRGSSKSSKRSDAKGLTEQENSVSKSPKSIAKKERRASGKSGLRASTTGRQIHLNRNSVDSVNFKENSFEVREHSVDVTNNETNKQPSQILSKLSKVPAT